MFKDLTTDQKRQVIALAMEQGITDVDQIAQIYDAQEAQQKEKSNPYTQLYEEDLNSALAQSYNPAVTDNPYEEAYASQYGNEDTVADEGVNMYAKGGKIFNSVQDLIKFNEGFVPHWMKDGKGVAIGYGFNTLSGLISPSKINSLTREQADQLLNNTFLPYVTKMISNKLGSHWNKLTPGQQAALIDLTYQRPGWGYDAAARIKAGDMQGARALLSRSKYVNRGKYRQAVWDGNFANGKPINISNSVDYSYASKGNTPSYNSYSSSAPSNTGWVNLFGDSQNSTMGTISEEQFNDVIKNGYQALAAKNGDNGIDTTKQAEVDKTHQTAYDNLFKEVEEHNNSKVEGNSLLDAAALLFNSRARRSGREGIVDAYIPKKDVLYEDVINSGIQNYLELPRYFTYGGNLFYPGGIMDDDNPQIGVTSVTKIPVYRKNWINDSQYVGTDGQGIQTLFDVNNQENNEQITPIEGATVTATRNDVARARQNNPVKSMIRGNEEAANRGINMENFGSSSTDFAQKFAIGMGLAGAGVLGAPYVGETLRTLAQVTAPSTYMGKFGIGAANTGLGTALYTSPLTLGKVGAAGALADAVAASSIVSDAAEKFGVDPSWENGAMLAMSLPFMPIKWGKGTSAVSKFLSKGRKLLNNKARKVLEKELDYDWKFEDPYRPDNFKNFIKDITPEYKEEIPKFMLQSGIGAGLGAAVGRSNSEDNSKTLGTTVGAVVGGVTFPYLKSAIALGANHFGHYLYNKNKTPLWMKDIIRRPKATALATLHGDYPWFGGRKALLEDTANRFSDVMYTMDRDIGKAPSFSVWEPGSTPINYPSEHMKMHVNLNETNNTMDDYKAPYASMASYLGPDEYRLSYNPFAFKDSNLPVRIYNYGFGKIGKHKEAGSFAHEYSHALQDFYLDNLEFDGIGTSPRKLYSEDIRYYKANPYNDNYPYYKEFGFAYDAPASRHEIKSNRDAWSHSPDEFASELSDMQYQEGISLFNKKISEEAKDYLSWRFDVDKEAVNAMIDQIVKERQTLLGKLPFLTKGSSSQDVARNKAFKLEPATPQKRHFKIPQNLNEQEQTFKYGGHLTNDDNPYDVFNQKERSPYLGNRSWGFVNLADNTGEFNSYVKDNTGNVFVGLNDGAQRDYPGAPFMELLPTATVTAQRDHFDPIKGKFHYKPQTVEQEKALDDEIKWRGKMLKSGRADIVSPEFYFLAGTAGFGVKNLSNAAKGALSTVGRYSTPSTWTNALTRFNPTSGQLMELARSPYGIAGGGIYSSPLLGTPTNAAGLLADTAAYGLGIGELYKGAQAIDKAVGKPSLGNVVNAASEAGLGLVGMIPAFGSNPAMKALDTLRKKADTSSTEELANLLGIVKELPIGTQKRLTEAVMRESAGHDFAANIKNTVRRLAMNPTKSSAWLLTGINRLKPELGMYTGFSPLGHSDGYTDVIDAYLYNADLSVPGLIKRVKVNSLQDYGPHAEYIKENYPRLIGKIPIYDIKQGDMPIEEVVKPVTEFISNEGTLSASQLKDLADRTGIEEYYFPGPRDLTDQTIDYYISPRGSRSRYEYYTRLATRGGFRGREGGNIFPYYYNPVNIAGHLVQLGVGADSRLPYIRHQDIWKFLGPDYLKRWYRDAGSGKLGHDLGKLLDFVNGIGTPIVTRGGWSHKYGGNLNRNSYAKGGSLIDPPGYLYQRPGYKEWLKTVPKDRIGSNYDLQLAYNLEDPEQLEKWRTATAKQLKDSAYHLHSVYMDPRTGYGYFAKLGDEYSNPEYKDEKNWYFSPEGKDFRTNYQLIEDGKRSYYRPRFAPYLLNK